jgi:hypothetical protein
MPPCGCKRTFRRLAGHVRLAPETGHQNRRYGRTDILHPLGLHRLPEQVELRHDEVALFVEPGPDVVPARVRDLDDVRASLPLGPHLVAYNGGVARGWPPAAGHCRRDTGHAEAAPRRLAILPWGDPFEDYLDTAGLSRPCRRSPESLQPCERLPDRPRSDRLAVCRFC